MHRTVQYIVSKDNPLYISFDEMGHLANNIHNAALFRLRQVLSGIGKEVPTPNEQEILDEIKAALPAMNAIREKENAKKMAKSKKESAPYEMPTAEKSLLGFPFLDALMKVSHNPDYFSKLPRQTTQAIIKEVRKSIVSYFAALREYKANPTAFTGKPKLPYYRPSGGIRGLIFTNQDCEIRDGVLKFPKTKALLQLGDWIPADAKLKEVKVKPYYNNSFLVCVVIDNGKKPAQPKAETPSRIAAIDFGVDNIIAMANNIGQPGLLIKGGVIKSANQWFNKKRADIVHGITSGGSDWAISKSLDRLSAWRDGLMRTELHTYAKWIIAKCAEWDIDTLVLGVNHGWKQGASIGRINNQTFVSIPHTKLRLYLTYLAEEVGIRVVEQEESYTSKASFLDMDPIPVFGDADGGNAESKTSGYRIGRGNYKSKTKQKLVNADLNGAGNILRKAFPTVFDGQTEYKFLETCIVLKHVKK